MGFHWKLFRKPEPLPHVVIRYVAATKGENTEVRNRRASKEAELISFLASKGITQPEQLRAARELGASVRLGRG